MDIIDQHIANIDLVLQYFKDSKDQKGITTDQLRHHFHKMFGPEFTHHTISYLDKLERDSLIFRAIKDNPKDMNDLQPFFFVSLEGLLFDSYKNNMIKEEKSISDRIENEKNLTLYTGNLATSTKRLNVGTWIAGLGTSLLALIEVLKHHEYIMSFFHCK